MGTISIQDRTTEFRSVVAQAQKRLAIPKAKPNFQNATSPSSSTDSSPSQKRSAFARQASSIAIDISSTMTKLEKLAILARRRTLFDDRPMEISELTYIIKQDLSRMNGAIGQLSQISKRNHPVGGKRGDQEGQHNETVVVMLQGKLADVSVNFKEVLEVRTKNIQASRSRQDNFVNSVGQQSSATLGTVGRTDSPLYSSTVQTSRGPTPIRDASQAGDLLSLDPPSTGSALTKGMAGSEQQMLLLEEGQQSNGYIQQRGEAIEAIERTISDLGGIFGQLAQMVSEQSEMIQRIDANTDDVVDNVEGAQRELMKYWSRMQGNRWLVAKMFGVLMICKCLILSSI